MQETILHRTLGYDQTVTFFEYDFDCWIESEPIVEVVDVVDLMVIAEHVVVADVVEDIVVDVDARIVAEKLALPLVD